VIDFFADLPPELAVRVEQLSRRSFELREDRRDILQRHGAANEEALLCLIEGGEIAEYPARYDRLAALEMTRERQVLREELATLLAGAGRGA
jgi:hypothetical protein